MSLMQGGSFSNANDYSLFNEITLYEPLLQASSSPVPRTRIWPTIKSNVHNWQFFKTKACFHFEPIIKPMIVKSVDVNSFSEI